VWLAATLSGNGVCAHIAFPTCRVHACRGNGTPDACVTSWGARRRYKEAAKACTATLETMPAAKAAGALRTRAKAYEALGLFKQALADVSAVNKAGEGASDETRAQEARLVKAMKGMGASADMASAAKPATTRSSVPYQITVKATLGGDTRTLQVSLMVSYAELLDAIRAKFEGCGACMHAWSPHIYDSTHTACVRACVLACLPTSIFSPSKQCLARTRCRLAHPRVPR
jgi:hypothetical protein